MCLILGPASISLNDTGEEKGLEIVPLGEPGAGRGRPLPCPRLCACVPSQKQLPAI